MAVADGGSAGSIIPKPTKSRARYSGHPTNPTSTPYTGHPTNPAVVRTGRIANKLATSPVARPLITQTRTLTPEDRPEDYVPYSGYKPSIRLPSQAAPAAVGTSGTRQRSPITTKSYGWGLGLRGLVLPVEGDDMEFSSAGDFGPRVHPVHGGYSNHTGVDMSGATGTPILAVAPGRVNEANIMDSIYGNQVIMGHGQGMQSMYGHMAQLAVEAGQRVHRGDVIGYMGETGLATGPHLHFETWNKGTPVDPRQFLRPDNMIANLRNTVDPETQTRMMNRRRSAQQIVGNGAPSGGSAGAYQIAPTPSTQASNYRPAPMPAQQSQVANSRPAANMGGNPQVQAFLQAMAQQESGGNYGAVGVPTSSGTAYGKYQILDSNFAGPGGWDMEALDRDITIEQYMRTPQFQEKIARSKLKDYFKSYGPEGAAKAWYAGPGNAMLNSDSPQYGGPSVNDYAASVLAMMMQRLNGG